MGAQSDPASTVQGHVAGPMAGDGITVYDGNGVRRVLLGKIASNPDDYGLKMIAADGSTTIIDGTSDMFRISATGLLVTSGAGFGQANASITLPLPAASGITTCLMFNQGTGLVNANVAQCPVLILSAAGAVAWSYTGWVEATADPTKLLVVAQTTASTAGAGGMGSYYRYYLLAQTGS